MLCQSVETSLDFAIDKAMSLPPKHYREQLYRLRAHPRNDELADFKDARDSYGKVYLSILPFALLEYFFEVSFEVLPGGLVFPVGFLLFWAFYYTFYQPGFLENPLNTRAPVNLAAIPTLILGLVLWFLKATLEEVGNLFRAPPARKAPVSARHVHQKRPTPPPLLSPDLIEALHVLGLKPGCTWRDIHKQYRHLAKQFHPDLNPDITDFGHRFMRVDSAYHKLGKVRAQHFRE